MDYTPSQKRVYIKNSDQPSTFEKDTTLPPLPVPSVEQTINKYLKSIQPFVDKNEYHTSEKHCNEFLQSNISSQLQGLLLEKAKVLYIR